MICWVIVTIRCRAFWSADVQLAQERPVGSLVVVSDLAYNCRPQTFIIEFELLIGSRG